MNDRRFRRLLSYCPTFVLLLWMAGVAHLHDVDLDVVSWLGLVAVVFALRTIGRRLSQQRPLPQLPPGANPAKLAALVALLVAAPGGALAGVAEAIFDAAEPSRTSLALRTLWHAACLFAGKYCEVLVRLTEPPRNAAPPAPPPA